MIKQDAAPNSNGGTVSPESVLSVAQLLVKTGMVSSEHVSEARATSQREHLSLGQVLVRDGLVLSRDLAALASVHLGLTMVDLRSVSLEPRVVSMLPQDLARRYCALPMEYKDGRLTVAVADPTDLGLVQDLTVKTQCSVETVVATTEDILEHIDLA